ncbi:hypothetical protein PoB_007181400, partial [Plakobranchus ocellatus]
EEKEEREEVELKKIVEQLELSGADSKVLASPQQGDLRLSDLPSGQGAGGGARTHNRRVPADLRADSLITVPPSPLKARGKLPRRATSQEQSGPYSWCSDAWTEHGNHSTFSVLDMNAAALY